MDNKEKIYKYLLGNDVSRYEKEIFEIIPELKSEKGFEQKSPWHCYDVWNHTLKAISACDKNEQDRLVLLLHDIGKPFSYQEENGVRHFAGHAEKSKEMSEEILNRLGIHGQEKIEILRLIEWHAKPIKAEDINKENIEFYKRLLKIKVCDAKAYEKKHIKVIMVAMKSYKKQMKAKARTLKSNKTI